MKLKKKRLEIIREIINTQKISCQVELLQPLTDMGIEVTQATLSRDLKQLKIAKVPDSTGRYIYTLPKEEVIGGNMRYTPSLNHQPMVGLGGFLSISFSYNLVVIKTSPGYAGSIAYDIDNGNSKEILGTVAGDDTIIIILAEGITHEVAYRTLSKFIPALRTQQ
ncbi:MAG: ArgR family transcriptional regulator [Bacteroidaceae bacterium]|nr:ArgR family transcriptional regulator [Bacteroidaceae bacterium]